MPTLAADRFPAMILAEPDRGGMRYMLLKDHDAEVSDEVGMV